MNNKKASDTKARPSNKKPLDQQTTYHFDGRSFVVQPVFKEENANTLGAVLLRIMQADCENSI